MKHMVHVSAVLLSLSIACGSADFTGNTKARRHTKTAQNGGGSLTGGKGSSVPGSDGAADADDGDDSGSDSAGTGSGNGSASGGLGASGSGSEGASSSGSDGGSDVGSSDGSDGDDLGSGSDDSSGSTGGSGDVGLGSGSSSGSDAGSGSLDDGSGSDDGTITGPRAKLTIQGLRQDDDDVTLMITTSDGKSASITWPGEGQNVELDGLCSKPTIILRFTTVRKGQSFAPANPQCFVGKPQSATSVAVGFEDDCNSLDYNKIDEEIAVFSCPGSQLSIEALRLDPSIDMGEWID